RRFRRGSDGPAGGLRQRLDSDAGMDRGDREQARAALEEAERRHHVRGVARRGDVIEALDKAAPVVLRAPDDRPSGRGQQQRRARAAGQRDPRLGRVADDTHVDPPLAVDLHPGQQHRIQATARGEVEHLGEREDGAATLRDGGVDGRAGQVLDSRAETAGDVQHGQPWRVRLLGEEYAEHRQRRGEAEEDGLAVAQQPRDDAGHQVRRGVGGDAHGAVPVPAGAATPAAASAASTRSRTKASKPSAVWAAARYAAKNASSAEYSCGQAVGQAPYGATTTASTRKPGKSVSSGWAAKASPSTSRSVVTSRCRAARPTYTSSYFGPRMRAFPAASASWTWTIAQSGSIAGMAKYSAPV